MVQHSPWHQLPCSASRTTTACHAGSQGPGHGPDQGSRAKLFGPGVLGWSWHVMAHTSRALRKMRRTTNDKERSSFVKWMFALDSHLGSWLSSAHPLMPSCQEVIQKTHAFRIDDGLAKIYSVLAGTVEPFLTKQRCVYRGVYLCHSKIWAVHENRIRLQPK